ncbi:MAG: hypothetical protein FWD44_04000 [Oscillospiraceae bacterium]|nr:hypothetical protein [Oscillospiraceae bacterium]
MLTRTLLSNLSMNLSKMDKLQNQMATGRKYAHISDDPSALIYGQAARNKLGRLSHFQKSVETSQSWLTQAEAGVMELQKVVGAVYEELVSAGGPKTDDDKKNVAMIVYQLRDHFVDTLNASYGDRFVYSGYNTPGDFAADRDPMIKPFTLDASGNILFNGFNVSQFDGMPSELINNNFAGLTPAQALTKINDLGVGAKFDDFITSKGLNPNDMVLSDPNDPLSPMIEQREFMAGELAKMHNLMNDVVSLDVGPGITMPITLNGLDLIFFTTTDNEGNSIVRNAYDLLSEVYVAINGDVATGTDPLGADELTKLIRLVQDSQNHLLVKCAEIGGRQRRLELLEARYEQDALNYESMRSDAEDADMAEVIMYLKMAETVYQSALSAGARIIQPTLMDFLR